jgi:small-conductance mechanosensitive channel
MTASLRVSLASWILLTAIAFYTVSTEGAEAQNAPKGKTVQTRKVQTQPEKQVEEPAPSAAPELKPKTEKPKGSPVVLDGKTLFLVQERVFSFSPEERAAAVSGKIQRLSREPVARINAVHVAESEAVSEIVLDDWVIMTVTEQDARSAGIQRKDLAESHARAIRNAAVALHHEYSLQTILFGVLWTIVATAILLVCLKLVAVFFRKLGARVESWRGTRIRSWQIQKVELLPADRITDILISFSRVFRVGVIILLFYFYLPLVFSFFPWTRGYASVVFSYILYPVRTVFGAFAAYVPNLFFIAVIVVVSYYFIKLVRFVFREIQKGTLTLARFYPEWAEPTYKIARFLIITFTLVVIFPYLPGSDSPAFQGISIFLGVLFSIGSSSAVANVVAGIVLTYTRAFKIGDRVKIGETAGDVIEKTLLVTRVRTIKNVDIAIPNAMVLSSHIVNFSSSALEHGLILNTGVTIGYDVPWRKVHELLLAAAAATEHILKDPVPFVFQKSLDDFYVSYELNAYTAKPLIMARIYSELHQNIQDKFNHGGVEIMSPHYGALRDGNQTTVPEENLPKDYVAPSFRLWKDKKPSSGSINKSKPD